MLITISCLSVRFDRGVRIGDVTVFKAYFHIPVAAAVTESGTRINLHRKAHFHRLGDRFRCLGRITKDQGCWTNNIANFWEKRDLIPEILRSNTLIHRFEDVVVARFQWIAKYGGAGLFKFERKPSWSSYGTSWRPNRSERSSRPMYPKVGFQQTSQISRLGQFYETMIIPEIDVGPYYFDWFNLRWHSRASMPIGIVPLCIMAKRTLEHTTAWCWLA